MNDRSSQEQAGPALVMDSPLGQLAIAGTDAGISAIRFVDGPAGDGTATGTVPGVVQQCAEQLRAYFAGELRAFDVPLALAGTPFQQRVWAALRDIPFGETRTYSGIARALGDVNAVRAVGVANAQNPVAIVVPCHRVVGQDGSLVGYAGGLWRKEWLLAHEGYPIQRRLFE